MLLRRRTSGTRFLPKSEDYATFNYQLQTWRNDGPRCATLSAASTERGQSPDSVRFVREWELYQSMVFLVPHITHRRTKSTYRVPLQQTVDESASQHSDVPRRIDSPSTNNPDDFIDPGKNFVPNFVNT